MTKPASRSNNTLLKECLFTALVLLMDQKDFQDITISEIAKKAGVSRMAYYRIYSSKEDILRQYFMDQFHDFTSELAFDPNISRETALCKFYHFFKEQVPMLKYLQKAGLQQEVGEVFVGFITQVYESSRTGNASPLIHDYEAHFIAGGLMMLLLRWGERGMLETPEEMADISMKLFQ